MKFAQGSFTITPTPDEKPVIGKRRTVWSMIKTTCQQAVDTVAGWIG
ncbi:hypothetical protein KA047_02690 [Candidatus Saccharibacteria bacterium]|nr:hypothetical protein [Candidatus Saccharibacteria bacterium]